MNLGKDFIFSANNLQDYLDCPRRFELKYILKQNWPAISSQPVQEMEFRIQQGNRFHQIVNQFLSNIPIDTLKHSITDPDLSAWFTGFQEFIKPYLKYPYHSEFLLTMPLEGHRLIAVFDFITQISDSEILIIDWKTTTRRPKKEIYLQTIQFLLYPLIAFENQKIIFPKNDPLVDKMISMTFWFPNFPESTLTNTLSYADQQSSRKVISNLISEIAKKELGEFEKTANEKHCAYCHFRSLCERGIAAGHSDEDPSEYEDPYGISNFDLDAIDGLEF